MGNKIISVAGDNPLLKCEASGGSQAWSVEECFAFDHAAARTPRGVLEYCQKYLIIHFLFKDVIRHLEPDGGQLASGSRPAQYEKNKPASHQKLSGSNFEKK